MKACHQYPTIALGSRFKITGSLLWPPVHTQPILVSACSSRPGPLAVPQLRQQPLEGEWVKMSIAVFTHEETEAQRGYFAQVIWLVSVAQIFLAPDPVLFPLPVACGVHVS